MNFEYFIASRLTNGKDHKSSVSAPIIKIAISAVAIGMVMMIVSVATGVGLQQKIRQKVSGFNGHILISNYDDNQSEVSVTPVSKKQDFYPKFKTVDGISHVQAVASKAGIVRTEKAFEGIIFKGVGADYKWSHVKEYIVEGRHPVVTHNTTTEILMSKYLAGRLELKVGDKCNTFFMKSNGSGLPNLRVFEICGLYDSGIHEYDASYIIGDIKHIQRMNKWTPEQVGAFEVFVNDFTTIDQKAEEVYNETGSTLDTMSIKQKYAYIFEWLDLFDFNIVVIIGIMILVASINMIVALLVLILERTQMIGILKALGAGNMSVRKVFLFQAFHLISRGLAWGNAIGIAILLLQIQFGIITLDPENYYVHTAPVSLNLWHVLLLNIGTIVTCVLVLLIPSFIITKISPAKAIRFD